MPWVPMDLFDPPGVPKRVLAPGESPWLWVAGTPEEVWQERLRVAEREGPPGMERFNRMVHDYVRAKEMSAERAERYERELPRKQLENYQRLFEEIDFASQPELDEPER